MQSAQELQSLLAAGEELTIVRHNNPDPDCLASALALGRRAAASGFAERRGRDSGDISHQQNRAFINLLEDDIEAYLDAHPHYMNRSELVRDAVRHLLEDPPLAEWVREDIETSREQIERGETVPLEDV
jgi:nanoRNase/pAp phosphatase (c-di-AMP/oligoRNAs hydrolase)